MTTGYTMICLAVLSMGASPGPTPSNRPGWVERGPVVDDGVWEWSVRSGWWATPEEALGHASAAATKAVVRSFIDSNQPPRYLRAALVPLMANGALMADSYTERNKRPYGTMVQVHLLVELGAHQRAWLATEAQRLARVESQRWVWRGLLFVLAAAGVATVYWHLDLKTRGYATGRLRVLAVVTTLAAGAAIWHWV